MFNPSLWTCLVSLVGFIHLLNDVREKSGLVTVGSFTLPRCARQAHFTAGHSQIPTAAEVGGKPSICSKESMFGDLCGYVI